MDRLREILSLAPKLSEIFNRDDIMVAITDTKQFLHYSRSQTMDANILNGMPFLDHDLFGAMRKSLTSEMQIAPADYGPPFIAVGSPILNEKNQLIGGIGFGINLNAPQSVVQLVTQFSQSISGGTRFFKMDKVSTLNDVCGQCGCYGYTSCAGCPVELHRQEEVLFHIRSQSSFYYEPRKIDFR